MGGLKAACSKGGGEEEEVVEGTLNRSVDRV